MSDSRKKSVANQHTKDEAEYLKWSRNLPNYMEREERELNEVYKKIKFLMKANSVSLNKYLMLLSDLEDDLDDIEDRKHRLNSIISRWDLLTERHENHKRYIRETQILYPSSQKISKFLP